MSITSSRFFFGNQQKHSMASSLCHSLVLHNPKQESRLAFQQYKCATQPLLNSLPTAGLQKLTDGKNQRVTTVERLSLHGQ